MKDPRRRKNVVVRLTPRQGAALKRWLARTAMEAPDQFLGRFVFDVHRLRDEAVGNDEVAHATTIRARVTWTQTPSMR